MRKPRPFSHSPIYIDERRERLADIEQRARQQLGLTPSPAFQPSDLRGAFARVQHHQRGSGWFWNIPMLLTIAFVLTIVLIILLS